MKKMRVIAFAVIFAVSFIGCENTVQKNEGHKEQTKAVSFPENCRKTVENVTFELDVTVEADLEKNPPVTAKAQMQKVNVDKAFQLFYSSIKDFETYEYDGEDEYGKKIKTGTYVSPDETTLSYGPVSSQFCYMKMDLLPYIRNACVLETGDGCNAGLYSTKSQLAFMTRSKAFETVKSALKELELEMDYDCTGYALDYRTLQSQEYHEDIEGNIDRAAYKKQWAVSDECYYFCISQKYRGLPLYHVYCSIFTDVADANAPVQAVVSEQGTELLEIEKVFAFSDEKETASLLPFDDIIKTVADKYNQVLGNLTYKMTEAGLYYYVDLSSGAGVYETKPVWIFKGTEINGKEEKEIQVIVDAQTGKEIVP